MLEDTNTMMKIQGSLYLIHRQMNPNGENFFQPMLTLTRLDNHIQTELNLNSGDNKTHTHTQLNITNNYDIKQGATNSAKHRVHAV